MLTTKRSLASDLGTILIYRLHGIRRLWRGGYLTGPGACTFRMFSIAYRRFNRNNRNNVQSEPRVLSRALNDWTRMHESTSRRVLWR